MNDTGRNAIQNHYGLEGLVARVARALEDPGPDRAAAGGRDLELLDQFHVRGLAATRELAEGLDLPKGAAILDVGCGLGGPARYLAGTCGWRVTGIDLSQPFIEVARMLADRAGFQDQVRFTQADALDLPFADASFDAVWTQHVAMNIEDKAALYRGFHRLLKPGGLLAIYDVTAGSGPVLYPVPWALGSGSSFLLEPEAMRQLLLDQGFSEISWLDRSEDGLAWLSEPRPAAASGRALGLDLVMGPGFPEMKANLGRNLKDGRVRLIQAIFRRNE